MFKILIALQFLSVIMAIRNTTNHTSTHLENIIRVITPISFDDFSNTSVKEVYLLQYNLMTAPMFIFLELCFAIFQNKINIFLIFITIAMAKFNYPIHDSIIRVMFAVAALNNVFSNDRKHIELAYFAFEIMTSIKKKKFDVVFFASVVIEEILKIIQKILTKVDDKKVENLENENWNKGMNEIKEIKENIILINSIIIMRLVINVGIFIYEYVMLFLCIKGIQNANLIIMKEISDNNTIKTNEILEQIKHQNRTVMQNFTIVNNINNGTINDIINKISKKNSKKTIVIAGCISVALMFIFIIMGIVLSKLHKNGSFSYYQRKFKQKKTEYDIDQQNFEITELSGSPLE